LTENITGPLISVLHPTRRVEPSEAFPSGWQAVFREWISKADDPSRIEYVIAVHESRWDKFWHHAPADWVNVRGVPIPLGPTLSYVRLQVTVQGCFVVVVKNSEADTNVAQVNCAAAASSGMLLVGTMDDLGAPDHWDSLLLKALDSMAEWSAPVIFDELMGNSLADVPWPTECLIHCSTGAPAERDRELFNAGAITRNRYRRIGYMLHPAFESMYADNYLTWEAKKDQAENKLFVLERLDILFEHRHPSLGKGLVDEAYQEQNRPEAYRQGFATFRKLTEGTRVLAVLLPGETFSHEWVVSWCNLMIHLNNGPRFIVGNHWCHSSNVFHTRIELARSASTAIPLSDLVLWADDDNLLSIEHFETLLADLDSHPELAGVVAWCLCDTGDVLGTKGKAPVMSCGRQGPQLKCLPFSQEDMTKAIQSERWLISSDDIAPDAFWSGFPVVLMRASALRQLGWEAFLPMLISEVVNGMTSEDTTFFYRAHEAGLKFAVDLRVEVPHLKLRAVNLAMYDRLQVEIPDSSASAMPGPSGNNGLQQPEALAGTASGEDSVMVARRMSRGLTVELL
jgi:hypothetical protein